MASSTTSSTSTLATTNLPPPPTRIKLIPLPNFRPKSRRCWSFCRSCCCTTYIVFLIFIFAFVITIDIFYLIYEPSLPQFRLASFCVPSLNISNSAVDDPYFNVDTTSRVEVKNRIGKMTWHFGQTRQTSLNER
ncbi:hypothetical protein Fmac_011513 [Flemingia macrophylla]|uniref:Late embryogenesis abundant protein LEA-2 subgroup domain-containing protein n=1 Tax=Flemingia macrophylla TaxID=520843 RepID=A0ABD1MNI8_9FABA